MKRQRDSIPPARAPIAIRALLTALGLLAIAPAMAQPIAPIAPAPAASPAPSPASGPSHGSALPLTGLLDLEGMTSAELGSLDRERSLIVMVAAPMEQHGPHLPLATDIIISKALARAVAERFLAARPDWAALIHPALAFSPAYASEGFPGNAAASSQALADCLGETLRGYAALGFRYCLIIDNHLQPETQATIARAITELRAATGLRSIQPLASLIFDSEFRSRLAAGGADTQALAKDLHAGYLETSAMLAIDPALVKTELLPALEPFPMSGMDFGMEVSQGKTMRAMGAAQGYVGYPDRADAAFGQAFLDIMADMILSRTLRLVDPADKKVFGDTASYFSKLPMQGPSWIFAYPMASGTAVDGFTPGILTFGQSSDRLFAQLFAGWGTSSAIPVFKARLAVQNFFMNPLEFEAGADNAGGSRGASAGLNLYSGYLPPGFRDRPPFRAGAAVRMRESVPSALDPLFSSSGPLNSVLIKAEYDPGIGAPPASSETGTASHEPFMARASYEYAPTWLGNGSAWDLFSLDLRWYLPLAGGALKLTGKSVARWGGLLWPDGSMPGQALAAGASADAFRGFSRLDGNLFSRELLQSIDLRARFPLPPNPIMAAVGASAFADAGYGSAPGASLFSPESFRLDAGLSISLIPGFMPMAFRLEFAAPLSGKDVGEDYRLSFGIGDPY